MIYYPDSYTLIRLKNKDTGLDEIKVFACFYGVYAHGDSWKLSSGTSSIKEITLEKKGTAYKNIKGYEFKQYSGSSYVLSKQKGRHTTWIQSILDDIMQTCLDFEEVSLEEAIDIITNSKIETDNPIEEVMLQQSIEEKIDLYFENIKFKEDK